MDLSAQGQGQHIRPFIESTYLDGSADYAHDGKHIVFISTRSGRHDVWIAAADGSHLRQVTHGGGMDNPRLSPDGTHVVSDLENGENYHLCVTDVETGTVRTLTDYGSDANAR